MRELPDYLRPLPGPNDPGAERRAGRGPEADEAEVKRHPRPDPAARRGHSGGFITDVIVDLGFATREQVDQAIEQSRTAGRAARGGAARAGRRSTPSSSPGRRRALRARLRRPRRLPGGHGRGQPDLGQVGAPPPGGAGRLRRRGDPAAGDGGPANVLALDDVQMATGLNCRVAVAPAGDIEALIGKLEHAAEHRRRGDRRGRRRSRRGGRRPRSPTSAPRPRTRR